MEQQHIYFSIISQRTNMFGIVETPQMKKTAFKYTKIQNYKTYK